MLGAYQGNGCFFRRRTQQAIMDIHTNETLVKRFIKYQCLQFSNWKRNINKENFQINDILFAYY